MSIKIKCHGDTHVGRHRSENEDQFLIAELKKSLKIHQTSLGLNHQTRLMGESQGKLLLVADGLGGHSSGERASNLAVDGVTDYVLNALDWCLRLSEDNEAELIKELRTAFFHSQKILGEEEMEIPQRRGMATTLTMAYIVWPSMYVVHVGDTRCYIIRNNEIKQITTDHTIANLMDSRKSAPEDSKDDTKPHNPMSHMLWNVIGGQNKSLNPQVEKVELEDGDRLLLCSDGLTGYFDDSELRDVICSDKSLKQICRHFIDCANARGGKDNITSIVAAIDHVQEENAEQSCVEEADTNYLDDDFVLTQP